MLTYQDLCKQGPQTKEIANSFYLHQIIRCALFKKSPSMTDQYMREARTFIALSTTAANRHIAQIAYLIDRHETFPTLSQNFDRAAFKILLRGFLFLLWYGSDGISVLTHE